MRFCPFGTRSKVGGVSKLGRRSLSRARGAKTQSCNGLANRASSTFPRRALGGKHHGSHRRAQTGKLARQTGAADDGGGPAVARLRSSCRVSAVGHRRPFGKSYGRSETSTPTPIARCFAPFFRWTPCPATPFPTGSLKLIATHAQGIGETGSSRSRLGEAPVAGCHLSEIAESRAE